jgi:hypothetical protein
LRQARAMWYLSEGRFILTNIFHDPLALLLHDIACSNTLVLCGTIYNNQQFWNMTCYANRSSKQTSQLDAAVAIPLMLLSNIVANRPDQLQTNSNLRYVSHNLTNSKFAAVGMSLTFYLLLCKSHLQFCVFSFKIFVLK